MDGILGSFLANLSSDQLLEQLSRYLRTPESNRDSDFYLCLKSVLITLKEQDKLLDDSVSRVIHELCLPVVRCGDVDDDRQKVHIVYEITALCCAFGPKNLVQEIVSLCLEGLSNHSKEIVPQTGLPVVVCVDFISYLMKDDVKQVVDEVLRKELFDNLLTVLYHADELMCMKITSSVLPLFLSLDTTEGQERILSVWKMIKEMSVDKHNGDGLIKLCYSIMCSLADFFIADGNSKNHVLWDSRFWELIQQGLNTQDPLSSKRSMYLLKRALDHVEKQKLNMEVKGVGGGVIFYWNPEQSKCLMEIWQEFVLLMETLNETQVHVIKPVLSRISKIITATEIKQSGSLSLGISWLTAVITKASLHPNRFIRKWAVMAILTLDLSRSPLLTSTNWSFLLGYFQSMLNEYSLYGPDDDTGNTSPIGIALISFYNECLSFLPKEQHVDFLTKLLAAIEKQKFTPVPMVFISQSLSCIKNTSVLGSDALYKMRNILTQLRTHPTQMRVPTKEFILTAAAKLTDPNLLDWDVIFLFLATGNLEECLTRGSCLWNALCDWLWKIESEKKASHSKENSPNGNHLSEGVFQFLGRKVESFLNNPDVLEDSSNVDAEALGRLIIAAVDTLHKNQHLSDNDYHSSPFFPLLSKITQIFHDASTRLYMSETKLSKATTLLAATLRVLNSSDNYTITIGSDNCCLNYAMRLLSQTLQRSLTDIMSLVYRKLTTVEDENSSGKTYLELCDSLHCFFAANKSLKSSRAEFYKVVEDVAINSVKTIQRLQRSQNYGLKEMVHFQQSVCFVAWYCDIIPKCKDDLSASATEEILHAIPSFQLNLELKKPEIVVGVKNGESTANNAAISSLSWGSLVSELMSALWTITAFFLQHNEEKHKTKASDDVIVITSPVKDILGAAIDALDITSNVLPIIKSIGLLIPNLLQTDVDLCSRALDIVWKTLRDMWNNTTFWEDFPVFLSVFFSPVLLMLPADHQMTKKIKGYLETLLIEGESRPGIMHAVILQLSNVWVKELKADCHASLHVHLDAVIQMLVFGPMITKANRIESYIESYLRHLGNKSCPLDTRDDTQVRVTMTNVLLALDSSNTPTQDLFKRIIRSLIVWDQEVNDTQTTIYINSQYHRKKHRAWQTILILLPLVMKHDTEGDFSEEILRSIFTSIQDQNQLSVQNFQQWIVLNILTRYPHLTALLWDELLYHQDKRVGRAALLVTIATLYAVHCVPADQGKRADVFSRALSAVFPWVAASHRNVRVIAQVAVQRMWYCCVSEGLLWVLKDNAIIEPCLALIKAANDTLAEKIRLLEYYFFFDFNPIRDLSIETVYHTIPKHSGITQEEWVQPGEFQRSDLGKTVWIGSDDVQKSGRIPLYNKDRRLANFQPVPYDNKEKFAVHLERRIREERKPSSKVADSGIKLAEQGTANAVLNVQKKMIAWKIVPPEDVMMADLQQQRMLALQKSSGGNLVVVASLIDKAPNLGGLCRTSEIFGVRKLVLGSTEIMKDQNFKNLSVSAAKWIDIEQVRPADLKGYLQDMRRQGYTLIGVEQTANSQPLTQYQFPHDSLLLLGNEKEGIPADLIQLLDECVEIPQVGIIRSLNVHVSGALLIWEYTRQRLLTAHSTAE